VVKAEARCWALVLLPPFPRAGAAAAPAV